MKILVHGAGAVGGLLGGALASGGGRVSLLGRPDAIEAVRLRGLSIADPTGAWGSRRVIRWERLATDARRLPAREYDAALLSVRTTETAEAAEDLARLLKPDGFVVSCQNGVGPWEQLAERLGWNRVLGGVVSTGVASPAPGCVDVTVQGFPWRVGLPREAAGDGPTGLDEFVRLAERSPCQFEQTDNVDGAAWRKLVYNAALNALATLRGGAYANLLGDAEVESRQERVIEELWNVGCAHGVRMDPGTLDEMRSWFWKIFERTASHEPSMLAHLRRGRRTEIAAINGAIVRLGERHGVPTPENARLVEEVRALEDSVLGKRPGDSRC